MAQPTHLFDRYDGTNAVREDLSDTIYNISPEDSPFMSNIGRATAKQTYFEWQTDALAAVDTANAQIEGDDATLDARVATSRVGNYTQISRKVIGTSGTVEAVGLAGMKSYKAYEMAKASSELKRDMEAILLNNQAAVVGNASTARQTAGLPAWIITNTQKGTGAAADPTLSGTTDGYPNAARTDGTQVTYTEAMLKTAIQSVWAQGGDPKVAMAGPTHKAAMSAFTGIQANRQNISGAKAFAIVATADIYLSDFGKVSMVPNRYQREREVFVFDPSYAAVAYLRPFQRKELAKTGDSEKTMLLVEYGLKVKTEKAFAIIADLT
jgi:hypothetical protein